MSVQPLNGAPGGQVLPSAPPVGGGAPPAAAVPQPDATPQTSSSNSAASAPSTQQVQEAAKLLERYVQPKANALQFSVDSSTGSTVVRVVDSSTGDLVRQIPSEEVIRIAESIDPFQGLMGKIKA